MRNTIMSVDTKCGRLQKRYVKADERVKDLEDKWREINDLNKVQYVSRKRIQSVSKRLVSAEKKRDSLEKKVNRCFK